MGVARWESPCLLSLNQRESKQVVKGEEKEEENKVTKKSLVVAKIAHKTSWIIQNCLLLTEI